jgi:hypothetical protein
MSHNNLSELFTIPKGNIEVAGSFYGDKVYTSDKLKEAYIKSMAQSSKGGPLYKKIKELVDRSVLIPAYKTKSIFKSLLKLHPINLLGIAGAAIPNLKKIYILIETEANLFSFVSNNAVASVTIHEMTHLLAILHEKFFYKTFLPELTDFYHFYFCEVFKCDNEKVNKKDIEKLCEFIYKIETNEFKTMKFLKDYQDLIKSTFKEHTYLQPEIFDKRSHDFIVSIYTIFKAYSDNNPSLIERITYHFRDIYRPLYLAYKHVFGANLIANNQLAYQELFTPSEIICTLTLVKAIPPKLYKALEKL